MLNNFNKNNLKTLKLYTLDNKFIKETDDSPVNFTGIVIIDNLDLKCWKFNGVLHREDGAAVEYYNFKLWYWNSVNVSEDEHKVLQYFNQIKEYSLIDTMLILKKVDKNV